MAYQNVKKLMNDCADPATYNFELECEYEDYKALPQFERFLVYKSTALGKSILADIEKGKPDERQAEGCYHDAAEFSVDNCGKYPNLTDCDGWDGGCRLAVDLYEQLWGWKDGEQRKYSSLFRTVEQIGALGGDTLNSVQTTLNCYVQDMTEHNAAYRQHLLSNGGASIRFCIQLFLHYGKDFIEQLGRNEALSCFVRLTHTMGNLILTPMGYNGYRGTAKQIRDYADLSLYNLLHNCDSKGYFGEDTAEREKKFAVYINFSFLWDYVEKSADGKYEVRPLCDSHRLKMQTWDIMDIWDNRNVLPGKGESEKISGNISSRIIGRGIFMAAMLEISLKYPAAYLKLLKEVFLTDRIYEGYVEVISVIREKMQGFGTNGAPEAHMAMDAIIDEMEKQLARYPEDALPEILPEMTQPGSGADRADAEQGGFHGDQV